MLMEFLDRPIAFQRAFVNLGAGITGALLLSQAVYWDKRTNDAGGWFYKTQQEWEEETGLSRYEQEGARKKLKAMGILEETKRGVPCKTYYRINKLELEKALIQYAENQQTSLQKTSKPDAGKSASQTWENQRSITENTAEITQETTTETTNKKAQAPACVDDGINSVCRAVFSHWQNVHGKTKAKLTSQRLQKIKARLKEGYQVDQLCKAIDGVKLSPYHMGKNDTSTVYDDLTTILRDGAQVEKFSTLADNPHARAIATGQYSAQTARNIQAAQAFLESDHNAPI